MVRADGLILRFNFALDPASYHLEQWNYLWSSTYGSDQYSACHPGEKGHDRLKISSIKLSENARQVVLAIPGLRPRGSRFPALHRPCSSHPTHAGYRADTARALFADPIKRSRQPGRLSC